MNALLHFETSTESHTFTQDREPDVVRYAYVNKTNGKRQVTKIHMDFYERAIERIVSEALQRTIEGTDTPDNIETLV